MCIGGSSGASTWASTSCLRTRPPRPLPSTFARSMLCSAAIRMTTGEYLRDRSSPCSSPASPGASSAAVASPVPVSASASLRAAPPSARPFSDMCASPGFASVAIRAITVPTSTVSPTWTIISATRPVAGDSTSVSILSVEIAAMISSAVTQWPTCFFHSTTVPSATDTPIWGIVTSTYVSVLEELTACLPHVVDLREDRLLERRRERDRHVRRGHAHDRPVEVLPAVFFDQRRDLCARRARLVGLVDDDDLRALAHRSEDRLLVERAQRAQVEHLDRRAVEVGGRLERGVHHRAVGDHGQVGALARGARGERCLVEALGHLALDAAIEVLVLHEQHRVGVAHGGDQQALGVLGRGGGDDLDAGRVQEPRLGVLRVERAAAEAAAARQPDGDVHREPLAVVHLPGDVDELIEAAGDEVGELHL